MNDDPLNGLDDAIEAFLRDTDQLSDGSFITGWAIGVSTARIQSEDTTALPMMTGATYALGPQTSIVQMAGLAKYLDVVSEKATWAQLDGEDDDEWPLRVRV